MVANLAAQTRGRGAADSGGYFGGAAMDAEDAQDERRAPAAAPASNVRFSVTLYVLPPPWPTLGLTHGVPHTRMCCDCVAIVLYGCLHAAWPWCMFVRAFSCGWCGCVVVCWSRSVLLHCAELDVTWELLCVDCVAPCRRLVCAVLLLRWVPQWSRAAP